MLELIIESSDKTQGIGSEIKSKCNDCIHNGNQMICMLFYYTTITQPCHIWPSELAKYGAIFSLVFSASARSKRKARKNTFDLVINQLLFK